MLASCTDTSTFGGLIALQNLLNESATPPSIVSISYGECEAENGAAANAASYLRLPAGRGRGRVGVRLLGDEGAASCDADQRPPDHGIAVSGFASTPYNVAVGGTDFGDTVAGTISTYWVPEQRDVTDPRYPTFHEIPWNDSAPAI